MEDRINYALKNFFTKKFEYEIGAFSYTLLEESKKGKTRLFVNVNTEESICFNNYDKFPKWEILVDKEIMGMKKCIDHFILKKNPSGIWELHMFEMKTSIGFETWNNVKYKLRASYLSIKAIAVYLGIIIKDENIIAYTTYENDKKMNIKNMTDSKVTMPRVGGKAIDVKKDEWDAGFINIPLIVSESNPYDFYTTIRLQHKKILMNRAEDDFLENTVSL